MIAAPLSTQISNWIFLSMVAGIPCYGFARRVKVYESFIKGAKEGVLITVRIIPYLVAMIVAIGMFRASGAVDHISSLLGPMLGRVGIPTDILPMILIRPFSGSAANGLMAEIIHTHGGNAYISSLAATIMGSTETTFYVIAVYFGAANIRRTRHAVPAGLIADLTGVIASVIVCQWLFLS